MTIGVSDTLRPSYRRYEEWVKRCGLEVEVKKLSPSPHGTDELKHCDGLVLTGGGDIDPKFYGGNGTARMYADIEEVDVTRDEFELGLVHEARRAQVPLLGICRGMQLVNVAMGGSLIPDVEKAGFANHRKGTGAEKYHPVVFEDGTLMQSITHLTMGVVNTNHHQAVDRIGTSLRVSGRSEDGLVESLEREGRDGKGFVLLVQWHPERMKEFESPCSQGILQRFITEVRQSYITSNI
jgi:putative glutamine amidotransferase